MLDGLSTIDWSALSHAYGPAEDVPDQLRALAAGGAAAEDALCHLYGNIYHQGTVYAATAAAVPFLVEVAAAIAVPVDTRAAVLGLVWHVAGGTSYHDVHGPLLLDRLSPQRRAEVARRTGEELVAVRAVRQAVTDGADVYARLLADPSDPTLRAAAARPLAAAGVGGLPRLRGQLTVEPDPLAAASMLFAVATLAGRMERADDLATLDRFVAPFLAADRPPVVRLAAAVAALQLRPDPAGLDAVVRESIGPAAADVARLPWSDGDDAVATIDPFLTRHPACRSAVLLALLDNPTAIVRAAAVHALQSHQRHGLPRADAADMADRIARLLADDSPDVRSTAASFLADAGPARDRAWAALARLALDDPSDRVRGVAASSVAAVRDPAVLPTLLTLLDRDPPHPSVVQAMAEFGPAAAAAVPRLVRVVRGSGKMAASAALALVKLGPGGRTAALPVLLSALSGRGPTLPPMTLAAALGEYGPEAGAALAGLRRLLDFGDAGTVCQAAVALCRVGGDATAAVAALTARLSPEWNGAKSPVHLIAHALGRIGPAAAGAVDDLRRLFGDGYFWTRVRAVEAVWRIIGRTDADLLAVLARDLHTGPVSLAVAECLRDMGPAARPLVGRMREVAAAADPLPGSAVTADTDARYRDLLAAAISAATADDGGRSG